MSDKCALVIGVAQSGQLPRLDGALVDSKAFAEWAGARGRDYRTTLITDEREPVTVDRIRGEIAAILKSEVDRLILFYSGHGICSQIGDFWLLSNFERDSDEAVNLTLSMRNARRLGIRQIALFSDACRSSLNAAAFVAGRSIFPRPGPARGGLSHYDEFLSTEIGEVAQEVAKADATKSYGVFSRCLLTALHGLDLDAAEDRDSKKAVTSQALATWLEAKVPLESGKISGGVVQYPALTPSWRRPDDTYAEFDLRPDLHPIVASDVNLGRVLLSAEDGRRKLSLPERRAQLSAAKRRVSEGDAVRQNYVEEKTRAFSALRGRESFETQQGLTVVGARIVEAVGPEGRTAELFEEMGNSHVRGAGGAQSIALRTEDGSWLAAQILPKFIATLVVGRRRGDSLDHGGREVESLNYAPPRSMPVERDRNLSSERMVAEWNALLNLDRRASPKALVGFAEAAREMKHINPAFGILAAYAYERAGEIEEMVSIGWHFAARNHFVPYDVHLLLSAYGDPAAMIRGYRPIPLDFSVAGGFPLLTQGWALLDPNADGSHPGLLELRDGLTGGVWTGFDARRGARFAQLVKRGEI
jgi:hypothetical protein